MSEQKKEVKKEEPKAKKFKLAMKVFNEGYTGRGEKDGLIYKVTPWFYKPSNVQDMLKPSTVYKSMNGVKWEKVGEFGGSDFELELTDEEARIFKIAGVIE